MSTLSSIFDHGSKVCVIGDPTLWPGRSCQLDAPLDSDDYRKASLEKDCLIDLPSLNILGEGLKNESQGDHEMFCRGETPILFPEVIVISTGGAQLIGKQSNLVRVRHRATPPASGEERHSAYTEDCLCHFPE